MRTRLKCKMEHYKACLISGVRRPGFTSHDVAAVSDACAVATLARVSPVHPLYRPMHPVQVYPPRTMLKIGVDDIVLQFPQSTGQGYWPYSIFNLNTHPPSSTSSSYLPDSNGNTLAMYRVFSSDYEPVPGMGDVGTNGLWSQTMALFRNNLKGTSSADEGYMGNIVPLLWTTFPAMYDVTQHRVSFTSVPANTIPVWFANFPFTPNTLSVWIGNNPPTNGPAMYTTCWGNC